jgi:multidrug efflux system membrane fusion protein
MNKKALWIALGVLTLGAAASVYHFSQRESQATPGERRGMDGGRPVPVVTAAVKRGDIDVTITALGTVTARNTATVKPRVDGLLQRIAFQEGQLVKAGDLLAEIDPRPYQALLDQANGQLVRDQALLANAQIDLERYRTLLAKDSIARQQVEAQEALVKQYQGTLQADRGTVDNAKLQLAFTRITAPLSGRLGLRQVDAGNMLRASDATGIVVITQTQPIMVVFAIAADNLTAVVRQVQAGEKLQVEAWDREGKLRLASGQLLSLDNQIDTTTGTVKLKAEFANTDNALFPNQFVNARLRVETRRAATLMPLAAVQRGTLGTFVYVVNGEDKTVSTRSVTLGANTIDTVAIDKGLEPGELVVVDGADKLRQGARIEFSGAQAPAAAGERERKGPRGGERKPAAEAALPAAAAETAAAPRPAEAAAPAGKGRE